MEGSSWLRLRLRCAESVPMHNVAYPRPVPPSHLIKKAEHKFTQSLLAQSKVI